MSMNLAELGLMLCQEFDHREDELKTLHSEIRTRVKSHRTELIQLRKVECSNQQVAKTQIRNEVGALLSLYRVDRETLAKELRNNRISQRKEMNSWAKVQESELKGWHKAGAYMLRKRTGR